MIWKKKWVVDDDDDEDNDKKYTIDEKYIYTSYNVHKNSCRNIDYET